MHGYAAFLSYSRTDEKVAGWLHRKLDTYRTPRRLVGTAGSRGPVRAKLHPTFRDRTDFSAGGQLSERIARALQESDALVVVCSQSAATSKWVDDEAQAFVSLQRMNSIYPIIAPDQPDVLEVEESFFPPTLRGHGLLAADLREIPLASGKIVGDGRQGGLLKLVAGLLGLPLDQLVRRERRRQRRILLAWVMATVVFALIAVIALWQRLVAVNNMQLATENVGRVIVERSEGARKDGNYFLAAKYLLAAVEHAPTILNEQQPRLAALVHVMGPLRSTFAFGGRAPIVALDTTGGRWARLGEDGVLEMRRGSDQVLWRVQAHELAGAGLALSPNGSRLASVGHDGALRIWDVQSGRPAAPPMYDAAPLADVVFGPKGDLLVTLSQLVPMDGTYVTIMWQVGSADAVWRNQNGWTPLAAAVTEDGSEVVVVDAGGLAYRCSTQSGALLSRVELYPGEVDLAAIDPTGQIAVLAMQNGKIIAADTRKRQTLLAEWEYSGVPTALALGHSVLAVGYDNGRVAVVDIATGRVLGGGFGHLRGVLQVALSGDERVIASTSDDGRVRTWDPGWRSARLDVLGTRGIAISSDHRRLVTAANGHVSLFSLPGVTPLSDYAVARGDEEEIPNVLDVSFSDPGDHVLIVDSSGRVTRWLRDGSATEVMELGPTRLGRVARNGTLAVVPKDTPTVVALWVGGRETRLPVSEASMLSAVEFSRNGSRLIAVSGSGDVLVWDVEREEAILKLSDPRSLKGNFGAGLGVKWWARTDTPYVSSVALSADGAWAAVADRRAQAVSVVELDTGNVTELPVSDGAMSALAFSDDGRLLAAGGEDHAVVIDLATTVHLATFDASAHEVAFLATDALVTSGMSARSTPVEIWRMPMLSSSPSGLQAQLCDRFLGPDLHGFSKRERDADPLISRVWELDAHQPRVFCPREGKP